jgi:hypothetical protein
MCRMKYRKQKSKRIHLQDSEQIQWRLSNALIFLHLRDRISIMKRWEYDVELTNVKREERAE